MLQSLLALSDRQATESVRCRIDFKYAMATELDYPSFHHSVLTDFRDRLAEDDLTDRLLDLALARLKEAGLVHERTTQRSDSTHALAAVRDLTRLGLITEAVRVALEEVAGTFPRRPPTLHRRLRRQEAHSHGQKAPAVHVRSDP
ncbi:transposase [Streptomyces griseus]|uniref:transposase n=1 Tax=Streptomyces griseus TaxID=1911 RepID=UPI0038192389